MGITLNKESYEKLINEDIERLEKDMKHCPESDHIKAVLLASIPTYYVPRAKVEKCPKCGSKKLINETPMSDSCYDCGHQWMR